MHDLSFITRSYLIHAISQNLFGLKVANFYQQKSKIIFASHQDRLCHTEMLKHHHFSRLGALGTLGEHRGRK